MKKLINELPTLTTPVLEEILYVYLAVSQDAVIGVLVADRQGKQTPIRHVTLVLRAHPIKVITDQPIKQILNKPEVSGKLAKYAVELGAYNITYVPRNAIKGQVLADFINEIPAGTKHLEVYSLTNEEILKEWTLYTDEASSLKGVGAGLVLIDLTRIEYTYAIRLNFPSTNNKAEYEALLAGLRIAKKIKKADVLSKLASVAFHHLTKDVLVEVLNTKFVDAQEISTVVEEEEDNWMTPIIKCLEEGACPADENEARTLRMKINQYVMEDGVLFKKSYLSPMLRTSTSQWLGGESQQVPHAWSQSKIGKRKSRMGGRTTQHSMGTPVDAENKREERQEPFERRSTRRRWNNTTTSGSEPYPSGSKTSCTKGMKLAELKTKANWARTGKDDTGWSKHTTMVPTSFTP
ncbi:reverse transcriptase domain-containing protein [Tanacetum coccineum]